MSHERYHASGSVLVPSRWIHPTTPDEEIDAIIGGVSEIARSGQKWADVYAYSASTNEFHHRRTAPDDTVPRWFVSGWLNYAT